ncbi:undecaprenyl diphosphate synthase family protein [Mycobacterium riyadhense]|nr:undecaprenyl diphosphate synthase family protein [Mycobacterium riyadhense]
MLVRDVLWPDFSRRSLEIALADYARRERGLGGRTVAQG